jgi:hypothetical protein
MNLGRLKSHCDGFSESLQRNLLTFIATSFPAFLGEHLQFVVKYDSHHLGATQIKSDPDAAFWGLVCHFALKLVLMRDNRMSRQSS